MTIGINVWSFIIEQSSVVRTRGGLREKLRHLMYKLRISTQDKFILYKYINLPLKFRVGINTFINIAG